MVEFEIDSDSEQESDQEQLAIYVLINMESGNKWPDSPPQVYSVTISKLPTAAEFSHKIEDFKTEFIWFRSQSILYILWLLQRIHIKN